MTKPDIDGISESISGLADDATTNPSCHELHLYNQSKPTESVGRKGFAPRIPHGIIPE
jgi:hypothetical protein